MTIVPARALVFGGFLSIVNVIRLSYNWHLPYFDGHLVTHCIDLGCGAIGNLGLALSLHPRYRE